MKKQPIIIATLLLAGLLGFSQTARAVGFTDRLSQQEQRIRGGIASGQITPREAGKLYQDQHQVHQLRRHFLADGNLSRRERNTLEERMDRSNKLIYLYKHNLQRVQPPRYYDRAGRHFACY